MGSPENPSHFKFKCITNRKQVKQIKKIVLLVTFDETVNLTENG